MLVDTQDWGEEFIKGIMEREDVPEHVVTYAMDVAYAEVGNGYADWYLYDRMGSQLIGFYKLGVESTQEK
jgi:hypothetical protein